jgi:hypothetical protein
MAFDILQVSNPSCGNVYRCLLQPKFFFDNIQPKLAFDILQPIIQRLFFCFDDTSFKD